MTINADADSIVRDNESLYLYDPEDNHLEISRDRPPEELRRQAGRAIPSRRLVNELLKVHQQDQEPWQGAHPQTRIGHLLVRVVDLQEAERFYRDVLGFDVAVRDVYFTHGATFPLSHWKGYRGSCHSSLSSPK